jgi:hypothetical protein
MALYLPQHDAHSSTNGVLGEARDVSSKPASLELLTKYSVKQHPAGDRYVALRDAKLSNAPKERPCFLLPRPGDANFA